MNNRYLACVCAYGKGQEVHKNVFRPVRRKGERTFPAVPEWLSAYILCFHFFIALGGNVLECYTDCDAEIEASIENEVEMNAERDENEVKKEWKKKEDEKDEWVELEHRTFGEMPS